ncbi:phosphoenolpyruvate synthase [Brunnivagina elsteri CCALA 953]|uniref:Phosphoenolpyruvate synthase n=1 Tax=Brunnivagina elsteri CCALA 953 TaxID=987040 RepID=A0A2A2TPJ8_9CYAN|nr:phosphoenolpyruvate synthase [Calothrix elsteri CCALA 953]
MDKLYWLNEIQPRDRTKVGDKAFNLSRTMQRGYPVLPGFVVSTEFTREFLRTLSHSENTEVLVKDLPDSSLHLDVGNWWQLQQVASRLRQEMLIATLPPEWLDAIFEAASQWETSCLIFRPTVTLPNSNRDRQKLMQSAYRSNNVNDGNVNLSGLLESQICYCDRNNISLALKRAWSQLFRARSLVYWQRTGIDLRRINFGILVQPVWDAVTSGVIVGSSSFLEIQASLGLGLAITKGEVLPDYYKIKRENNTIIERKLGDKILGYRVDNSASILPQSTPSSLHINEHSCLITYLVDDIERNQFATSQEVLQQLLQISNQLTSEFGNNFGCEWTVSKHDTTEKLYLTQITLPQTLSSDYRLLGKGISAAGGRTIATAYVTSNSHPHSSKNITQDVLTPYIPAQLPNNTILVVPSITVDWLHLLHNISGIITEQGGMTSHAAILARELGIPAIVNVNRATELIKNGEQLLIDGDTGEIYRVNSHISNNSDKQSLIPSIHHTISNHTQPQLVSLIPPFVSILPQQEQIPSFPEDLSETYQQGDSEQLHYNSQGMGELRDRIQVPKLNTSSNINSNIHPNINPNINLRLLEEPFPTIATQLLVNLSQTSSIEQVLSLPIDGLGLLRSELMAISILDGQELHTWLQERQETLRDRWYEQILLFAQAFAPKPIFYRSLDFPVGIIQSNQIEQAHHLDRDLDRQSRLRERGTFAYLQNPTMFEIELTALAQVQQAGYGNLRLILPFVRSIEEFTFCRRKVEQAGLNRVPEFQLWIMAEVPSVLFLLPEYVKAGVQGIAIGTNDLTQLLLGVDREQGKFTEVWNQKNPAVMGAIRQLIETARKYNIPCTICGQAPTLYPEIIQQLVQWGITSISVEPEAVQRTYGAIARAEKRIILEAARKQLNAD